MMSNIFSKQYGEEFDAENFKKGQLESITNSSRFILKYFNLLVLLLMPFYAFMAKLIYGKPYNYAEHLVINSYIQGITFWVTTLIFVFSVFTNPSIYFISILFTVIYYMYVYGKLCNLTFAESILKFLIFLGLTFISFVLLVVIIAIAMIILKI